jgi:Xaa-Pro aminopeptidase
MQAPLDRLRAALPEGIDAILISDPVHVRWATGFTGSFGFVVLPREGEGRFLTDSRYTLQAAEQVRTLESRSFQTPKKGDEFLAENLREMGVSRLGVEADRIRHQTFLDWSDSLGTTLVPTNGIVDDLKRTKSPEEVERIRAACGLADATFAHVSRMIQPGMTEFDVALEIEFYTRRQGAEVAFDVIAVSGERSARPHGVPSDKRLEPGDFLTLDFGARLDGYCSDITRTVVVGEPTERHREIYGTVLAAQLDALAAMRPGVRAHDVDAVARERMGDLARYFGHGLGHGLGLLVHDGGRLGVNSPDVLAPGQVWTVEPGVYVPGFGGVRIEDDVVVTEDGIDVLTRTPKELLSLP